MKEQKGILSFALVLGFVLLVSAGLVSAINGVDITSPMAGQNVSGVLNVTWTNTQGVSGLTLQYTNSGVNCSVGPWTDLTTVSGSSPKFYLWNTTTVTDGNGYCLRLQLGADTYDNTTNAFTIDNTKPKPSFTVTGTKIAGETITFDASDSTDNENIEEYEWDFNNNGTIDAEGKEVNYSYSSAGNYTVVLTVTDFAGNTNSTTTAVSISEITYETDEISLTGVVEGIKNINYIWDTGLNNVNCTSLTTGIPSGITVGNSSSSCMINWTDIPFAEIGEYNVSIRANNGTSVKWYRAELTAHTWMISLSKGERNFVSIPYTLEDDDYKTAFEGIKSNLNRAWAYVYNEGTGKNQWAWMTGGDSWDRSDSFSGWSGEIVPGRGYIVFVDQDTTLYGDAKGFSSNPDDTPVEPASVKLANGYNLIGMFGNSTTTKVEDALSSLQSLEGFNYWNKVLDKNEVIVPDDSIMQTNTAYWISMKHLPDTATEDYYVYYI